MSLREYPWHVKYRHYQLYHEGGFASCNVLWKMTATNYWPPPRKASVCCSVVAVCKPLAQPRISVLLSGSLSDWVTIINTNFHEFITCQDKQLSFKKLKLSIKKSHARTILFPPEYKI